VRPAVRNARVLGGATSASVAGRLAAYLPAVPATEGAAAIDVAAIAVDTPGHGAREVMAALREAGASAWVEGERLVVTATRAAFVRAERSTAGAGHDVALELLRAFDADRSPARTLRMRDITLDLSERARVMGILNVTPDSFFDNGRYNDVDRARARAAEMIALGADLIDIGGQSYSAANAQIDVEAEAGRVVPVVRALVRDGLGVPLSVDTFRSDVAERALDAGAHLINDCSGLSDDRLAGVVARADAALVVMHLRGQLNVREAEYPYDDAMGEILDYLRERTDRATGAGVAGDSIVVDPGLEFGKEPQTDLEILDRFGELRSLGYPVLFAASRKSFIGRIFDLPASDLLVPSLATAAIGIGAGARLVRVHDIAETVAVARMLGAVRPENRGRVGLGARS
jgi:dihydropteroate synthase